MNIKCALKFAFLWISCRKSISHFITVAISIFIYLLSWKCFENIISIFNRSCRFSSLSVFIFFFFTENGKIDDISSKQPSIDAKNIDKPFSLISLIKTLIFTTHFRSISSDPKLVTFDNWIQFGWLGCEWYWLIRQTRHPYSKYHQLPKLMGNVLNHVKRKEWDTTQ